MLEAPEIRMRMDEAREWRRRTQPLAEPNCGSDTVYDSGAPVLPYGGTWRLAGFACESSVGGLQCTNQAGQGFTLARERWTTS